MKKQANVLNVDLTADTRGIPRHVKHLSHTWTGRTAVLLKFYSKQSRKNPIN